MSEPIVGTIADHIQETARVLMYSVLKLIQDDPHQWSNRPCSTCGAITSILGRPFGCYAAYSIGEKKRRD